MNQIVEKTENTPPQPNSFMSILDKAVERPDISPDALHQLIDAQERVMKKQAEIEFNEAMARLQPRLPKIKRKTKGHNSNYAKYEDIDAQVRDLYTEEGFSVSYDSKIEDGKEIYYGTLSHRSGHSKIARIALPEDSSGGKNAIQAKGSSMSYAKRYLLTMLLNIVTTDEDDDGLSGGTQIITEQQAAEIKNLLKDTGSDTKKFLETFAIKDVDSMPSFRYEKAIELLNQKMEAKQQYDF
ncbi:MAG: ERF family protein [Pseudomonadota bacterium]